MDPIDWSRQLTGRLQDGVPGMVGAYLHGSAALGGFVPGRSDIDLLFVFEGPLSATEIEASAGLLRGFAASPGSGIETSLLTLSEAADPASGRFQLHVATGADASVVFGAGHPGDGDLVLHAVVVRAGGIALLGPPPAEVFGEPVRGVVLAAIESELEWALQHAPGRYAVLNACRAALWVQEERVVSKAAGGEWGRARFPRHGGAIEAALAAQRGADPEPGVASARIVADVLDLVRAARAAEAATSSPAPAAPR